MQHAEREGDDGVGSGDASTGARGDGDRVGGGVVDGGYVCVEEEAGIVGCQEGRGFEGDEGVEAAGVQDEVVCVAPLIEA